MEHLQKSGRSQHQRNNGSIYPELVTPAHSGEVKSMTEREATYQAALKLVARIDEDLTRGIRHYRNKAGVLLITLDEVIRAILDNDLLLDEKVEETGEFWLTPQELAA